MAADGMGVSGTAASTLNAGGMGVSGMGASTLNAGGMGVGGMAAGSLSVVDGYNSRFSQEIKHTVGGSQIINAGVAPAYLERSSVAGTYRPISGAAHERRKSSSYKGYIGSYINEKLDGCAEEDQNRPARDCLLVYNHEGDGSPVGSIGSCSFIEDEPQFKDSYLDDLGPKFKMLADICVGKFESQALTVSADPPVRVDPPVRSDPPVRVDPPLRESFSTTETSISSSSGGFHGLNFVTDPPRMQKNYVVTTTINPVPDVLPGIADLPVAHQNVIMTKQVTANAGGMVIDPSIAHQNVVMTKQVNANAGGMVIDPSITHQNVIMTKQVNANAGGMVIDPSIAHQNVIMSKSVNVSSGGTQGMIIDPLLTQMPEVHKNVTLSRSIRSGTGQEQNMMVGSSLDQIPVIHKNVTLTRPSHTPAVGEGATFPLAQNSSTTRKSVTSTDGVHKTITKVTKVTQVMQE
ncbi:hypothetical protein chiPu_0020758 [Chiloscyllium punctatum]|uniref:Cadherin Y-type LIR-motif domain-containing protein n=1 Tax=Chiloscyllium punctatum TaxID=137246 RepID=A0A401RJH0_CHIPU|nr:hypothetical protein [Chiloscyllium punctatum]